MYCNLAIHKKFCDLILFGDLGSSSQFVSYLSRQPFTYPQLKTSIKRCGQIFSHTSVGVSNYVFSCRSYYPRSFWRVQLRQARQCETSMLSRCGTPQPQVPGHKFQRSTLAVSSPALPTQLLLPLSLVGVLQQFKL